jgi:DNA-binding NtrC family response regulator
MPTRSPFHELQRFLKNLRQPLYVVDDERRIVYLNDACAAWLGAEATDLLGRTCRYQSGDPDPIAAAADALCPPPEVFQGQRVKALVVKSNAGEASNQRIADFIPLAGENVECAGVLALVSEQTESPDPATTDSAESARLHTVVQRFRQSLRGWYRLDRLAGESAAMARVRAQVKLAAKTGAVALIVGPPGSGRQHAARTIHSLSDAAEGAFSLVSCSALPAELLRSTVGALNDRCRQSKNEPPTTILLADIDALPSELHHEFAKWLAAEPKNLRVLATAREPLGELARRGAFRAELAELLGTLVIDIPPLAKRREDIPLLAQMLLEELNGQSTKQLRGFSPEALDRLVQYDWPGEVDELAAIVRESCAAAEGVEVTGDDLPKRLRLAAEAAQFPRKPVEPIELEKLLASIETELIQRALRQAKGNKSQAAKLLGLNRPRLYRRMVQLGLESAELPDAEVVQFIEEDATG